MSYDLDSDFPDGLSLYLDNEGLYVTFVCPRCGARVEKLIDLPFYFNEIEIECNNPVCRLPEERVGYQFTIDFRFSSMYLGLNDRPLHQLP